MVVSMNEVGGRAAAVGVLVFDDFLLFFLTLNNPGLLIESRTILSTLPPCLALLVDYMFMWPRDEGEPRTEIPPTLPILGIGIGF